MQILAVGIGDSLVRELSGHHSVYKAEDGDDAVSLLSLDYPYEALIARMRAVRHDFIPSLRRRWSGTLIMLTAAEHSQRIVRALDQGADTCLHVPISLDEIEAHLRACARRANGSGTSPVITRGRLSLDTEQQVAMWDGIPVYLTLKQYLLLESIVVLRYPSKENILGRMYPLDVDAPALKIVDVFVCKIRKAFMKAAGVKLIETVWGRGYKLGDVS